MARRLSDDPSVRVLLLEAGGPAKGFWIGVPAGMAFVIGSKRFDWCYMTEPVPGLGNRTIPCPRGKTLGGSSAINGMVYTRGNRRDYDGWAKLGNPGWSWNEVLPYFKRFEDNERGASALRGAGGPWRASNLRLESKAVLDFVEAGRRCGLPVIEDLSVAGEEGVGVLQASVRDGKRDSTYDAYLAPVKHRENLEILTGAQVLRVLLEGNAASGVEVRQGGQVRSLRASREVVLSAGVVDSPRLLMLSGIGDGAQLQRFGIKTVVHSPGVGKNFQDHCGVHVKVKTKPGLSYNRDLNGWRKYAMGARYLVTRSGYLAASATLAAAFIRSSDQVEYADLEIGFRPVTFNYAPGGGVRLDPYDAISANVYRTRPASRGEILLRSPDPLEPAAIQPNYMASDEDLQAILTGLRFIRKIFATEPLASSVLSEEAPGANAQSEAQLVDFIRKNGKPSYHPVGTCKMGSDAQAVVDARLRVRGVERLRVVDASIMPRPSSGNTAAATVMIGEKGSDLILADAKGKQSAA